MTRNPIFKGLNDEEPPRGRLALASMLRLGRPEAGTEAFIPATDRATLKETVLLAAQHADAAFFVQQDSRARRSNRVNPRYPAGPSRTHNYERGASANGPSQALED